MLLAVGLLPAPLHAQSDANVIDVASLTLVPLPNQSIAGIKGSGLQMPPIGNTPSPSGNITLWDELKTPTPPQNNLDGISTITINNVAK